MSYRLGQTHETSHSPGVTGSKPGMTSPDGTPAGDKGGTDSSSMTWAGIEPGSPWSPTWSRGSTAITDPVELPPPPVAGSAVPWGAIAGVVGVVATIGIVAAVVRRPARRRAAPTPNRHRRAAKRRR